MVVRQIHESRNPQSLGLRFSVLLIEGDARVLLHRGASDRLGELLA
jgi:hypothetical protein